MGYLIGTDEAGYGPNLGPLVISATLWETQDGVGGEELYRRLGETISRRPQRAVGNGPAPLVIGDSKALYQSGKGLRLLERGLWAAFALLERRPRTEAEVWDLLAAGDAADRSAEAGYARDETPLPLEADAEEVHSRIPSLRAALDAAGVRLLDVQSLAIFPGHFNELVRQIGSKGTVLSRATLDLAASLARPLPDGPIAILCDKHGGRDRYLPLLAESFSQPLIEVLAEGRMESAYRFGPARRPVEIRFAAKGESHLPAALASMASKYFRELAMRSLNAFWRRHAPHVAPTAGYPQDAVRFKREIADAQARLGIDDHWIWRTK